MAISNNLLGSTATALVTGASGGTAVTTVFFCNNSADTATIDVFIAVSGEGAKDGDGGDSTADANIILKQVSINSADTYILDTEKIILGSGDRLLAQAADSSGQVVATASFLNL